MSLLTDMASNPTIAREKSRLRGQFIHAREMLDDTERAEKNKLLVERLLPHLVHVGKFAQRRVATHPKGGEPPALVTTVAIYNALQTEADITSMVGPLYEEGWRVAVPITDVVRRQLLFAAITPDTQWKRGSMGIMEPIVGDRAGQDGYVEAGEITVFCVPGLAFTPSGVRLGYGGGYYDRLFSRLDVVGQRIGIAYDCQLTQQLPSESHDVLMQFLATESGVQESWGSVEGLAESLE